MNLLFLVLCAWMNAVTTKVQKDENEGDDQ